MADEQPTPTPEQGLDRGEPQGGVRGAHSAAPTPGEAVSRSAGDGSNPQAEVVVTVDAAGNVVEAGDPAGAMVLRGADAEAALKRRDASGRAERPQPEDKAADKAESKARKSPPEDKGG